MLHLHTKLGFKEDTQSSWKEYGTLSIRHLGEKFDGDKVKLPPYGMGWIPTEICTPWLWYPQEGITKHDSLLNHTCQFKRGNPNG